MSIHWLDHQFLSAARRLIATDPALLSPTGRRLREELLSPTGRRMIETARGNTAAEDPVITRRHLRLVYSEGSAIRSRTTEKANTR